MLKHLKKPNRFAEILAERDGIVLYHAIEKDEVIYPNMVRPSDKFWNTYSA